jgi:hypothetical protein
VKFPLDLSGITYANFIDRLGDKLKTSVTAHRRKHGLNQQRNLPAK